MTDLKELLDEAAGPEPTVTDTDLSADLTRGQRALRRRRITGITTGAVATALVIGVGWSVLPSGTTNGAPDPAADTTKTPKVETTPKDYRHLDPDKRKPPVIPAKPVPLAANSTPFAGVVFTCDLIPRGWAVRSFAKQIVLYDPKLANSSQYHDATYVLNVWSEDMVDDGDGLTPAKYGEAWTKLPKVRAGNQQVVTTGVPGSPYGRQQVFLRQGNTKHLVTVTNQAWNLAWDMNTLLRFAGSCHYKK
ncbi:hypothetical protein [Kribbella jiaozuonensis]|uniref:Uncharacterized protein n=1 Tax=Kribbella jiaozuonensis TaxID=2575441 RepID=A0A4U3LQZ4_9ACTN|nr:hypothetical protein [Kribbella jiaozuonensis]TKK77799.1 hypothetical protein FDA38_21980 [Kribbella jiaozuonensis]